jgi:hypothetical protein
VPGRAERGDAQPQHRDERGRGGGDQPEVEHAVGAPGQEDLYEQQPDEGEEQERKGEPGNSRRVVAGVGELHGHRGVETLGGREQRVAHERRRLPQVGRTQRKLLAVQRPRRFDDAGVDGQVGRDLAQRRVGVLGRHTRGEPDQGVAGRGEVFLVAGPQRRRLGPAEQERAGDGGVGVGERAVEVLRGDDERAVAGRHSADQVGPLAHRRDSGGAGRDAERDEHRREQHEQPGRAPRPGQGPPPQPDVAGCSGEPHPPVRRQRGTVRLGRDDRPFPARWHAGWRARWHTR